MVKNRVLTEEVSTGLVKAFWYMQRYLSISFPSNAKREYDFFHICGYGRSLKMQSRVS